LRKPRNERISLPTSHALQTPVCGRQRIVSELWDCEARRTVQLFQYFGRRC
jgi:hypothetical protein